MTGEKEQEGGGMEPQEGSVVFFQREIENWRAREGGPEKDIKSSTCKDEEEPRLYKKGQWRTLDISAGLGSFPGRRYFRGPLMD